VYFLLEIYRLQKYKNMKKAETMVQLFLKKKDSEARCTIFLLSSKKSCKFVEMIVLL